MNELNVCCWHEHRYVKDTRASAPWEQQSFSGGGSEYGKAFLGSMCKYWQCVQKMSILARPNSCHPTFTVVYNNPTPCSTVYNKLTELQGYCSFLTRKPNPSESQFSQCYSSFPCSGIISKVSIHISLLCTCLLLLLIWQGLWTHVALRNPITYKCYSLHKVSEVNVEKHPFIGSCPLCLPIRTWE